MIPIIANYWTGNEVMNLLEDCGLSNIKIINVNDVSWCAVGTKKN